MYSHCMYLYCIYLLDLAALYDGAKGVSQFSHDHLGDLFTRGSRNITVANSVLGNNHIISQTRRVATVYQYSNC